MACIGLADLVYKRAASAGVKAIHFMMVQGAFFTPAIVIYAWVTGVLTLTPGFVWGMAAGFFIYIALYNFARCLASGAVSIIAPIFRLNFVLTATFAIIVLGEPLTAPKAAGLALALAAVWLLLGGVAGKTAGQVPLGQVIIATLAMAACNLCYKFGVAAGVPPVTVLVGQASVFFPMTLAAVWIKDRSFAASPGAWRNAPFTALLFFIGFPLLLEGLRRGEASVLIPIGQMGFIVTALCGMLFMHESFTLRRVLGLAAAAAALAMLAQG